MTTIARPSILSRLLRWWRDGVRPRLFWCQECGRHVIRLASSDQPFCSIRCEGDFYHSIDCEYEELWGEEQTDDWDDWDDMDG